MSKTLENLWSGSLLKIRMFGGTNASGERVLFVSYMPDLNLAIKQSNIDWSRPQLSNVYPLLKLPFTIRCTKVCRELGIGLIAPISPSLPSYFSSYLEICHERGIMPIEERGEYMKIENLPTDYFSYLMRKDGYEELTAGIQTSNLSMQYLQNFLQKYTNVTPVGKYAALVYNFKDDFV